MGRHCANRQSEIVNQPQAGIFHPLRDLRIFVPRILTPECWFPDFADWTAWDTRKWEACARTWLHPAVTPVEYIKLRYHSQDKYASNRGYNMSLKDNKCPTAKSI